MAREDPGFSLWPRARTPEGDLIARPMSLLLFLDLLLSHRSFLSDALTHLVLLVLSANVGPDDLLLALLLDLLAIFSQVLTLLPRLSQALLGERVIALNTACASTKITGFFGAQRISILAGHKDGRPGFVVPELKA